MLWEFANTLITERVTTGKRDRFLLVVIVGLETNATLKNRIHFYFKMIGIELPRIYQKDNNIIINSN